MHVISQYKSDPLTLAALTVTFGRVCLQKKRKSLLLVSRKIADQEDESTTGKHEPDKMSQVLLLVLGLPLSVSASAIAD